MNLDQVVLVGENDLPSLKLHVLATHANNRMIRRTFYIHPATERCQQTISGLRRDLPGAIMENVVFIDETTVLSPQLCANKWVYQQLLKLSVDSLRASHELSEMFLFTDVDTLCLRRTVLEDFQNDGNFIFFVKTHTEQPVLAPNFSSLPQVPKSMPTEFHDWFYSMNWSVCQLLGLDINHSPFLGAIDACVIWSQKIVKKLKRELEARFNRPWHQAIITQFASFIISHPPHFFRDPRGIRRLAFSLNVNNQDHESRPGFDELYHQLRLGFSEWQLYAYYLSTLKESCYKIGLLGTTPHPLVAEYNCQHHKPGLLDDILCKAEEDTAHFTNFIYFYPGVEPENVEKIRNSLEFKLKM